MMADISPILDAHIRKTMATPGHPSVAKFAVEIGLTQGQLAGYIYNRRIPVAKKGAAATVTRTPRPERKKSKKLRFVTDVEILAACRKYNLQGAAAALGVSTTLLMAEKKRLGIAKWTRLHKPSKRKAMGAGRVLAAMTDDRLREVLTTNTGKVAAEVLGVSTNTVSPERTRLEIARVQGRPAKIGRIPFAGSDPDEDEEVEPMVSKKRQRRQFTDAEILEAFYDSSNHSEVARTLGRDLAYVKLAAKRLNIHDVTRTPRIADPIAQRQELDDFMLRHVIKLGIWHIAANGDVVKHAAGVDPSAERIHPALLEDYERPAAPAPKSLRDPSIRRPSDHVVMKRFNVGRPKALPALDSRESAELIDEAIARGKLTRIQPGYARNV